MTPRKCGTCRWLVVETDKDGKRRVRKYSAYRCDAPVACPTLPDSITVHYRFNWPLPRAGMDPDEGTDCPCWEERDG